MLTIRTSNRGWTEGENPFRHIEGVSVAHSDRIEDHRYVVEDERGNVIHRGEIDARTPAVLRKLREKNSAPPPCDNADSPEPQYTQGEEGQMRLF